VRSLQAQDRSRGATPKTHTSQTPNPQQPVPKPTHPNTHANAAAGQGRSEHWIVATKPPKRDSAIDPPSERSLRAQDRSRGATPKTNTSQTPNPQQPVPKPTHPNTHTPMQQRDRAAASIGSQQQSPQSATARQPRLSCDPCERRTGPAEPPPRRTTVLRLPKSVPDCLIDIRSPDSP
jgi:hypothetical protein